MAAPGTVRQRLIEGGYAGLGHATWAKESTMAADIRIRLGTIADADTISGFNVALAAESEDKALDPAVVAGGVRRALADPTRSRYYIAEVDGTVAGQTMITREWSDWRDGWFWWIQSVFVHPAFRQRGVFRALHTHIRNEALRDPDVCGLRLYVHHDNERAIQTYKNLDMIVTEYHLCEEEFDGRPES